MADLSDVTAYLATTAAAAVYPLGTSQPSVTGADCRIYEGWPIPANLDADIAAGAGNVSIFPMQGTGINCYQILDETYTITPPSYGTSFTLSGNVLTVAGQPTAGEYITLVCDDAFVYSAVGADTSTLLAALATQAAVNYPATSSTATAITVPVEFNLTVRHGAIATLGKVTHRQKHQIMVTVWAPTPAARTTLAKAIDGLIKQTNKVTMPDTSQAIVVYNRTNVSDEVEKATIYRRDLIFEVEYATVEEFAGYEITSTQVSIVTPDATAIATAVTGGASEAVII